MKQDNSFIDSIISWIASPKDPARKRDAKQLVDDVLDDPAQLFTVGSLALIREKMLALPLLLELQKKAYSELVSPARLAEASIAEIINLSQFASKELHSTIKLAKDARYSEKPPMEERKRIEPVNRRKELMRLFGEPQK